jgi:hypothetical protein
MASDIESLAERTVRAACVEATHGLEDGRESALAELRFTDAVRRAAERLSQQSADAARRSGASWREVGAAVGGITPQGAEHRFSPAAKERRSKASKAEWASKERRRSPRVGPPDDRSFEADRS